MRAIIPIFLVYILCGCGVKGDPLPPIERGQQNTNHLGNEPTEETEEKKKRARKKTQQKKTEVER